MRVGELLAAGRTADVHAFGTDRVIKIPRPTTPSHWAALEAQICSAVHEHGVPAPAVFDMVDIGGRRCVVFERVNGPSMWQHMHEHPEQVESLIAEMVALQQAIHAAGVPRNVPDLTSRLRSKVSACALIDEADRSDAKRSVDDLPRGAALLHGDMHPGNVLIGSSGPMVIDWFDASIGHPIADVVRSSLLLRFGFDGEKSQPEPGNAGSLLARTYEAYVGAWQSAGLLDVRAMREWEPVLALARISEEADEETAPLLELWNRRRVAGT